LYFSGFFGVDVVSGSLHLPWFFRRRRSGVASWSCVWLGFFAAGLAVSVVFLAFSVFVEVRLFAARAGGNGGAASLDGWHVLGLY